MPKWATHERKEQLVALWDNYGNKCLFGHPVCPDRSHYVDIRTKAVNVPKPIQWKCQDWNGNRIRDKNGDQLYLTLYENTKEIVYELGIARLYDRISEAQIAYWRADDRDCKTHERAKISRALHSLGELGKLRGTFSAISRTIYHDKQPVFYVEGLGVNGLTFKPFAKVRIAGSQTVIYVELGETLAGLSKNRRRKAVRHGKPLEAVIMAEIDTVCGRVIRQVLK